MITRAIFANPFRDERRVVDCEIAGVTGPIGNDELFKRVEYVVAENIRVLREDKLADVGCFYAEDRVLVSHRFLFYTFHRCT